jgi:hypothetical protein
MRLQHSGRLSISIHRYSGSRRRRLHNSLNGIRKTGNAPRCDARRTRSSVDTEYLKAIKCFGLTVSMLLWANT